MFYRVNFNTLCIAFGRFDLHWHVAAGQFLLNSR